LTRGRHLSEDGGRLATTGNPHHGAFGAEPHDLPRHRPRSPRAALAVLLGFIIGFDPAAAQSPLDAPGEKPVQRITVGTELQRGVREIECVALPKGADASTDDYLERLHAAVVCNIEKNTDSNGFLLGARFSQWAALDRLALDERVVRIATAAELRRIRGRAQEYFDHFRALQRELKITDELLFTALGIVDATAEDTRLRMSKYAPSDVTLAQRPFTNLTRKVTIAGGAFLYPGARVKVLSRSGDQLTFDHDGRSYSVPVSHTTTR
jgi:hypothetical protein